MHVRKCKMALSGLFLRVAYPYLLVISHNPVHVVQLLVKEAN